MDIKKRENINVYNYNPSMVILPTRDKDRQYTLSPAVDGAPSMIPLTWNEVDYINSNSPLIKLGIIRFDEEEQEDVYKSLRNTDWKNILSNEDIEDILLNPTADKLQRIISITNNLLIGRVKGVLTALKNAGKGVTVEVDRIVLKRYSEISSGKLKTEIVLTPRDVTQPTATTEDVASIKKENKAMKDELESAMSRLDEMKKTVDENQTMKSELDATNGELEKMRAMMEKLLANQDKQDDQEPPISTPPEPPKKSPGRPPKKTE